ncbi:response regulator transcription factor [Poseidonocella sedimentorum]|uniref:Response regulator receiver domain-containing protein n=1 Tax=Poseidonocella sedimentorum TaxID=871652 RepID=A0A1I6CWJ0_9RHOB|nr:response regulator [Poseidonocella sedimentorum]SFQ97635.1 Response regulator receiver domain-containing protein [Poseidonocella sedimentorum]
MGKRVLLIEDEPNIIEAITYILSRDGWDVLSHSNGEDAVEAVAAHAPDIVILDVMLPGRSGYDILGDLRRGEATAELPIMMLTARGQARDREIADELGATRFMSKPFSNAAVLDAIRDMAIEA